jgi:uncharacterized iron-regulated protein
VGLGHTIACTTLAATLAALGGCAGRHPSAGAPLQAPTVAPETLVTATGAPLSPAAFAGDMRDLAYLLLGEEHPNPCDHLAQAATIRRLVKSGVRPAIGLEMVPADLQPILDAFNRGALAVADLPRALDWRHTWGFDFELYAPIFETAREFDLPVFALNAPQGLAHKVGKVGLDALTPAERASLPGTILPPPPAQVEELRTLFATHAALFAKAGKSAKATSGGRDPFDAFLTVQSLWDTQMASRARYARAQTGRPVVIVAGGGHVEQGYGIAHRLRTLDPGAKVVSIMPWRGGDLPDASDADSFYVCPAMHKSRLGLTLSQEESGPDKKPGALLVTDVTAGSPAALAGLLPGDAMTEVGGKPATALVDLHTAAIAARQASAPLRLTVRRAGEILTIAIPLQAGPPVAK